jgi:hypothetical protein
MICSNNHASLIMGVVPNCSEASAGTWLEKAMSRGEEPVYRKDDRAHQVFDCLVCICVCAIAFVLNEGCSILSTSSSSFSFSSSQTSTDCICPILLFLLFLERNMLLSQPNLILTLSIIFHLSVRSPSQLIPSMGGQSCVRELN